MIVSCVLVRVPLVGMPLPHGGATPLNLSITFRYSRLEAALPAVTRGMPLASHATPVVGRMPTMVFGLTLKATSWHPVQVLAGPMMPVTSPAHV